MGLAQERRVGHHGIVRTRTGTTNPHWKVATGRPIPAEDSDDVTIASLVLFASASAAIAAVAQRYAYKGSQKWLAPKLEARFGAPQLEA